MNDVARANVAFAGAFIDELERSGLRHACLCPGSRSTPLALGLARQAGIKTWVHLDERSASYFALGMARALGEPVALVCTSGTAAANFFPAIVEARYSQVPLVVLTADRPPELCDWGANQAVDQTRMYGSNAKWSASMPPPEAAAELLRYARATACRAVSTALEPPAGPVHVNFPFREPLAPAPGEMVAGLDSELPENQYGRERRCLYASVQAGRKSLAPEDVSAIAGSLSGVTRGVVVCGPQHDPGFPAAVSKLAARLGFPILADPLSQARCGGHDRSMVADCYDAFLRDGSLVDSLEPEVILRFGAVPTSKCLLGYMERHRRARQIMVQCGNWPDPIHAATDVLCADPALLAADLAAALPQAGPADWAARWLALNSAARNAVSQSMAETGELFEGRIFHELASLLPARSLLFAGNSMPVRDMDVFFPSTVQDISFLSNRGASGIDGVVSTALGAGAACSAPLVLVIGDLSFYHDMNGLLAARQFNLNATIIVVNNDGGGIFSFLPQSQYPEHFEKYFGTPHGLSFGAAASLYGLGYSRVSSWEEFRRAVSHSIGVSGTAIVEFPSERARNVDLHRRVWTAVARATKCCAVERR